MSEGQIRMSQAIHTCSAGGGRTGKRAIGIDYTRFIAGNEKISEESIPAGCASERGRHRVQVTSLSQPGLIECRQCWLWSTPQGSGQRVLGAQTPTTKAVASLPRLPHAPQRSRSRCHQHSRTQSQLCSTGWVSLADVGVQQGQGQGFLSQLKHKGE